jgi:hypothetical protein
MVECPLENNRATYLCDGWQVYFTRDVVEASPGQAGTAGAAGARDSNAEKLRIFLIALSVIVTGKHSAFPSAYHPAVWRVGR